MKKSFSNKKAEPVPSRVGIIVAVIFMTLMSASIAAGKAVSAEDWNIPVLLANGNIIEKPWYITIDGEKVALVESKEAADKTLQKVVDNYKSDDDSVLDVEVKETTSTEEMDIKNGDNPPEILTVEEAEEKIINGNQGEGYLTVVTTEEKVEEESIGFDEEYVPEPSLYVGETEIENEGKEGRKEVVKKVVKENGRQIEEDILNEEILEEPEEKVILTGVKNYDGYGGGSGSYDDEGLSYDENAVYGKLNRPVNGGTLTSEFGQRWGKMHRGLDIALAQGSDIYAADSGKVYFAGQCGTYGNIVKIDHGNGMQTYYAHCSQLLVSSGQTVKRGDKIALVGSTGNSTGPHVHFEVIINRTCVNPIDFIDF